MTAGRSTAILAHGLGGSSDLPIPYTYALIGAAWALTFTFAVVALAWKKPRFEADRPGRPLPAWITAVADGPAARWAGTALVLLATAWITVAAVFGPQDGRNPLPGVFYVLLWVGVVALSLLFGPVWRRLSPVRAVYRLLAFSRRPAPAEYPRRWGYWPAAAGLYLFVWLELASADPGSLRAVKIWLLAYLMITLAGTLACGTRWSARADPFEVYSMVASRLSPVRRNADGRIAVGNPFDHLPSLPIRPGIVAVLAVLLGSTAFDSFSAMPGWRAFVDELAGGSTVAAITVRTVGLTVFVATVATTFCLAACATGGVSAATRRALPGLLAHSLIPIVIGYVFAHYLTYLVERGQQTLLRLADPLGRGWFSGVDVSYLLSMHPSVLATLKVGFVLAGHIAGVMAAHDRALQVLPRRHQVTGQLAMMLVMVGYTFTGLYLLFGG
ncbi:hypothetical protein [Mycobacteroides salmoniphilum]|uniref:Fenitrothion hydrolase n=1 Tax=Mycobacteroides salmoniphilum TaxID=404941 RepID=A0A4R8STN1_9MYCO|nr:hypothetical protein [Mycobacteroides salmoniphilum]TDZ94389.1 hypothetical protein CCUG62472_02583 [Mycobacteroides salmoniphilum]TEA03828.1 hypothetical protein CCUG60884_02688 [Mycobacteroides salmoniphilum]